jgi:hypothetical protein
MAIRGKIITLQMVFPPMKHLWCVEPTTYKRVVRYYNKTFGLLHESW